MTARLFAVALLAAATASCSGAVYDQSDFASVQGRPVAATGTAEAATSTEKSGGQSAETAADEQDGGPAVPATDAPSLAATGPSTRGLLAFFRPSRPTSPEAADAAAAIEESAPTEPEMDEISEAELAGEVEADPDVVAVPEEPIDDGLEHDFVNVYTSRPEVAAPVHEGLPGVTWESGIVLVSRTPGGDDPSALFGGSVHPFARTVPGIPRQTVQAANGLLLAHSAINVSCVKPQLLNLVRRAEAHFGKKVVVTSGYRSPGHNRRVRGATHSQHLYCNALDLYMPGVARDDLARYFFAQSDRGGIGLYCHTRSIHIDTGKRRQWRWGCRRRAG